MKRNKIFVTGATGYIGSLLTAALAGDGYRPVAILQKGEKWLYSIKVNTVSGDTTSGSFLSKTLSGADTVIHLAGFKGYENCLKEPEKAEEANICLTQRLLEALSGTNAKIIFSSTYWVYGHRSGLPYREDAVIAPTELYGRSKAAAEELVASSGLRYAIVRLANVFGYGTGKGYQEAAALFLKKAIAGDKIVLSNAGRHSIDLISIEDVCRAFKSIIELDNERIVLNVGSGNPVSILELAEKVNAISERICGKKAKIVKGAVESDKILYADRWVDITRLKKLTDFEPEPLEASLERFGRLLLSKGIYEDRVKGSAAAISR